MSLDHKTGSSKAALALLTTTNGACFMLLLLTFASNPETSAKAMQKLLASITPRVSMQVQQWLAEHGTQAIDIRRLVDAVLQYVRGRLGACPSRSPLDFATYLEKLVQSCLDGGDEGVSTRRRMPQRDEHELLAPAPKVERVAVLHAILARLEQADRRVLELKLRHGATWESVARALGVSVSTAQRRHASATLRAQQAAVDLLAERLAEPEIGDAARAA